MNTTMRVAIPMVAVSMCSLFISLECGSRVSAQFSVVCIAGGAAMVVKRMYQEIVDRPRAVQMLHQVVVHSLNPRSMAAPAA